MNIAFVTDQYWPTISGMSVSIDSFRKEFEKTGHQVYILAPDYPDAESFDQKTNSDHIYRFRSHNLFFTDENRLVYVFERKNVFKVLNSIKPDIIHVHTEFVMGNIAAVYAKKHHVPLIMTAHTNWEELIHHYLPFIPIHLARFYCRNKLHRFFNRGDVVIVPTSLMELLLDLYFIKTPKRVIPTGINKSDFENISTKDESRLSLSKIYPYLKDKKILFFAGRIGKEKNISFLIDVLKDVLPQNPNTVLVIAGDGPAKDELMTYASDKKLGESVLFTGFIPRQRLKEFYSAADIFVFASKVESQGMVILESMACGTPVVAIGKMGTREVMGGDIGGYMVDDDIEMFVEKVHLLLNDPNDYKIKSKEALRHVDKWTINLTADKVIKLYQSLSAKIKNGR